MELAELESALEDARRGAGHLVVIEGSAGIGKTRLLGEAREGAGRTGVRILTARATELERDFPFALVRQLFEAALMAVEPSERDELLAGSARPAGPVVGVESVPADADFLADPSFATLNALYWLTSNLAEADPLMLAVDDAHWSDIPSLRFFRFLIPRLEDLPVLLVLAARPAEPGAQPEELAQLVADPATSAIRPHELSPTAVTEVVRERLSADADEAFCAACHDSSGGNPFMLRELLLELAADRSRGTAAEAVHVRDVAPATIQRAVLVRLARLPDAASALAQAVAVLGDDVQLPDAAELADIDGRTAAEAADALAGAEILEPARPLRFVHPLIRTAIYADLPGAAKAAAHERAANLLVSRSAEPERIALHLLATDPDANPRVVETMTAAARRALDRGAPETAAAYLRRGLAEPPATNVRLELMRLLFRAYFRAGDRDRFEELVESGAVEELADEPPLLLEFAAEFAHLLYNWGRLEEMTALLEHATRIALEDDEFDLAARFQATLSFWTLEPPVEARGRLDRLRGRIEADTPGERLYSALQAWWGLLTGASRATVIEFARNAVEGGKIWREYPDTPMPTVATHALRCADELDAAERALDEYLAVVGSHGSWATVSRAWERGDLAYLRGDVAEAEAEARIAVEVAHQAGFLIAFPTWLALLVEVLVERDDPSGAERELEVAGIAGATPDEWRFCPLLFSRARLRLAQDKPREALEDLLTFSRLAAAAGVQGSYHPVLSQTALALNGVGERADALSVIEEDLAVARGWGLPRRIGSALRAYGLIEGSERGIELLRESVAVLEDSPARLEHARSLADYGAALRRANHRAEAREPLRAALGWARRTGALAVARLAHEELEATGEKLRPLLAEGVESLTPSERRVAALAAEGHPNREIAQRLFLSVKTVEAHLSNAYRKLDIRSRRELAAALASSAC